MSETGWLIERVGSGVPRWLAIEPNSDGIYWTETAHAAIRFGRKQDGLAFLRCSHKTAFGVDVTEHSWG